VSLLDVTGLTIRYGDKAVVDGVDFSVERGASVGLVGASGAGKSQTALALMRLTPPGANVEGSVRFDGNNLLEAGAAELRRLCSRRVAMVFQDSAKALNPYVTVGRQLVEILLAHDLATPDDAPARAIEALARVRLPNPERQFRAYSHELSGGMRQRVMIAAALLGEPDLLIADEPTTALDVTVQAQILDLLDELRDDTALLLVTHDLGIVAGRCEEMLVMDAGTAHRIRPHDQRVQRAATRKDPARH
jgi:ABC-type glutathione transport system ATPase component